MGSYYSIMTTTLRARFDGKVLVPLDPVDLPIGTDFDVELRERRIHQPGSAQALLAAIRSGPPLQPGDTEALERAIEEAELPVRSTGAFDEADRP
jgi:hypothetical protein